MLLPFKKPSFYCLIGCLSQSEKIKTVTGVWLFTQELRNSKKCFEISDSAWELFIKSQVCFSFAPWCSSGFRNTSFPPCNCRGQGTACHATILAHASSRGPSHLHTPQPWRHPDCNTIFLCSLVKNRSEKNIIKKKGFEGQSANCSLFCYDVVMLRAENKQLRKQGLTKCSLSNLAYGCISHNLPEASLISVKC